MTMRRYKLKISRNFMKWRCPCYIHGLFSLFEDGERRRFKGGRLSYTLFKKYNIASSSIFDGIGKLKSGIWGSSPTKDNENFRYPAFVSFS